MSLRTHEINVKLIFFGGEGLEGVCVFTMSTTNFLQSVKQSTYY